MTTIEGKNSNPRHFISNNSIVGFMSAARLAQLVDDEYNFVTHLHYKKIVFCNWRAGQCRIQLCGMVNQLCHQSTQEAGRWSKIRLLSPPFDRNVVARRSQINYQSDSRPLSCKTPQYSVACVLHCASNPMQAVLDGFVQVLFDYSTATETRPLWKWRQASCFEEAHWETVWTEY